MTFDPFLAEHRFGYGRNSSIAQPQSVQEMLDTLRGPDVAVEKYPFPPYRYLQDAHVLRRRFRQFGAKNDTTEEGKAATAKARKIIRDLYKEHASWFQRHQMRRITAQHGFRERLVAFWADHFTVVGANAVLRLAVPAYVDEAIRPNVTGTFAQMLIDCVTHPVMLSYLDQNVSTGPNSRLAKRSKRPRGLNENLAREVMELHTLGVDGPYNQNDVRELAKLFTGLSLTRDLGFKFRPVMSEPGAETLLGRTYGGKSGLATVKAALTDLALHPATARHIATKIAVHFVSDAPPEGLIAHIQDSYTHTDGNLMACYEALLEHDAAWALPSTNMRTPDEFISASLRSLNVSETTLTGLNRQQTQQLFMAPLQKMGQKWYQAAGPDGFAEEDTAWVTPQGIAERMQWAMNTPARLVDELPDPREFVQTALGDAAPSTVVFAANAAATQAEGIGLILASPAFQRR
ncbi:DUF1800 domain containing protein [Sulfitobacter noctilucicola]|uniref:Uncharacterized protein (DUF1800 family) n=1 Tax=Sulfitobacter noctilucicola TaxID=1342301 RepID=A0A7W6MA30_9RHOB|nr:DUF1800 domain-containing protein [Sulfitobacter noctilucicola]KIN63238.1 DUF1800 domain containing protein [Sulfitobacter noctilucicola]MBB4175243.1 uncharacterized protein (DUF1800 family) [Sulfitobacter noctilucicola]